MKKKSLLWVCALLMLAVGMNGCNKEEEEVENYDPGYKVKYYAHDPYLHKTQRRYYYDKVIQLFPQDNPPYYLLVKWDSEEGKKALDYIAGKDDGVVTERYDTEHEDRSLIVCNKYISCPYLYISSSYKDSESFLHENEYVRIDCRILLKMKEGKSVEAIERKYAHVMKRDPDQPLNKIDIEAFDCSLKTSYEILKLAEEINLRDDVEWAEPNMWAPIHYDI